MVDDDAYLTAPELARRWKVTRATIYNLMQRGLPSVTIGRSRRFRVADVEAWLAEQQDA